MKRLAVILMLTIGVQNTIQASNGMDELVTPSSVQSFAQNENQQITANGTVVDEQGIPVIGATVQVVGTTKAIITDIDGKFSLSGVKAGAKLTISFLGYKTLETLASDQNPTLVLQEDVVRMDEVVIVGYGTQKKSDLTGGMAVIDSKKLDKKPGGSLMDKMQGQVAGLNVTVSNSKPGESVDLNVRGQNSLSASNAPLIILNGSPFSGNLNDIDPSTVETMSVLKDASSSAIYGSRAANGVILISTKKGTKGRVSVNYRGYVSMQSIERKMDLMKGPEWVQFMVDYNEAMGRTGADLDYDKIMKANVYEMYQKGIQTDWQDEMYRTSFSHNHQVSISGGTETATYFFSTSFLDDNGIVEGSNYKRYNVTANVDQKIGNWLTVGLNTVLTQRDNGGTQPYLLYGLYQSPYAKNYADDGKFEDYPMYAETLYTHPYANINGIEDNVTNNAFVNGYLDIKLPVKGLSIRSSFGYNLSLNNKGSYYGRNTLSGRASGGSAAISNTNNWNYTWENLIKYNNSWGKHNIDFTGLFSAQASVNKSSSMSGEMFVNDDNLYHQIAAAENNKKISSSHSATQMLSWMGRLNYGYDSRYLLTLTARADGYSAFGVNNKWAFFPSAAAAWVISKESFFSGVSEDAVSLLKLRVSYGGNGNQGVNPYQSIDRYTTQQYIWGDGDGTVNGVFLPYNGIGNPNLRWETTYSGNIGIDFGFINNRISGTIEGYQSKTSDLLMSRNVPVMNGYTSIMDNIGQTQNTGFEITLNTINMRNKDFIWRTSVNYSYNNDKIIKLREDGKDDVTNKWFIGENLRVYYDYRVGGVWQTTDDIKGSHQPNAKPGDSKLVDTNGDGKLTSADREIIGSRLPKHFASMTNEFSYKNFTFSFMLNGVFNVTKMDPFVNVQRFLPEKNANYMSGMNYWTASNPSNDTPSPAYTRVNDHMYYLDASFVRINDATLNYDFPVSVTKALKIQNLAVYVSGKNLYTFNTKAMKGYDPEGPADGLFNCYPRARGFVFGINIGF